MSLKKKLVIGIFVLPALLMTASLLLAGPIPMPANIFGARGGKVNPVAVERPVKSVDGVIDELTPLPINMLGEIGWQLSQAEVVSEGQLAELEQGTLYTDYAIQAYAVSENNPNFKEGYFQLTLSAFSPRQDMPGQKAGNWYIHGEWTVIDVNAPAGAAEVRHNPHVVKGTLSTELTFNPLAPENQTRQFDAPMQTLVSPAGGQWYRSQGTFSGNAQFEGALDMPNTLGQGQ